MRFDDITLGELSIGGKGYYGIAASAVEYSRDLYTYLRITDINDDGTINKEGLKSVDEDNAEKYLLKPNDIVFARTGGSTGRSYFYDGNDGEFVFAGFLIKFSLDPQKINPKFLKYYTLSSDYRGWVNSFNTGSTRGNINAQTYANMIIRLPEREQQNLLVDILSCLDDKIELNNRMNKNLEEMAQAIFKSWFVDFEPFQEGEFEESDSGMIPKGWRVGKLDECIDFYNGYAFKSKELMDIETLDSYRVFKMGHIKKGGGLNSDGTKSWISKGACKHLGKYVLSKGDLLMCMTDMKGNVALLGHTALMNVDDMYVVNQRVGLLRVNNTFCMDYPYLYILTNSRSFIENLRGRANSGVQVNLSTSEIKDSKILIPTEEVNFEFNKIVKPMFEKIFEIVQENQRLMNIRDTLLPKLMSGEVRVPYEEVI